MVSARQLFTIDVVLLVALAVGCSFDRAPGSAHDNAPRDVPDPPAMTDRSPATEQDGGCEGEPANCPHATVPEGSDCGDSCSCDRGNNCEQDAGAAHEPPASGACEPDCDGRECGADGCGGTCGPCRPGATCSAEGRCSCVAECGGKTCGDDGCGASCGRCAQNETCHDGTCRRDCDGCNDRECGFDDCGESCGSCGEGEVCNDEGRCKREKVKEGNSGPGRGQERGNRDGRGRG
jgi:hypothetical protein